MAVPEKYDLSLTGGRGGGKTRMLAALFLRHIEQHGRYAKCLIVRKSFPALVELETELGQYFSEVYGPKLKHDRQKHRISCPNGGTIQLDQLETENDFNKYQGKSYTYIAVDEAGQYLSPVLVDRLRSSLRAPVGVPVRFVLTANPGGPGHQWLAKRYAQREPWIPFEDEATGSTFVNIPSTYLDNDLIDQEAYSKNLMASCATDPELGRAWLTGDWSVMRGAYFAAVIDESRNRTEVWSHIPKDTVNGYRMGPQKWETFIAHDFGVSAPSVTYLCAKSPGANGPDGRFYPRDSIVLVDECALVHPDDLNKGLGLIVPEQAVKIKQMCDRWGVRAEGAADDAIFNSTGSQAGTIKDEFRRAGVSFRKAQKGGRVSGWQLMARLLLDAGSPDLPGLYVSRACEYWWQTVPALPRDKIHVEDIDTKSPDHAADACRYALTRQAPIITTGIGFAYAR